MGRKKGFTLVELLAVIVILSLISLITIPVVLNVVENSRLSAAKISGFNYVKAVNDEIQTNDMEDDSKEFEDGKYLIDEKGNIKELKINMKGTMPTGDYLETKNQEVIYAKLYINDYIYIYRLLEDGTISQEIYKKNEEGSKIILSLTSTSNKINAYVSYEDPTAKIKSCEYKLDDQKPKTGTNSYTFEGLKTDKKYTVSAKCVSDIGLVSTSIKIIKTKDISTPEYSVSPSGYAAKKTVTIKYDENEGLTNEYSLDGGETWETVNGSSVSIEFTKNGTVIARTTDGTNYKTASTLSIGGIDSTKPEAEIVVTSKTTNSINAKAICTDEESGITKYEFKIGTKEWIDNGTTNTYSYKELENNKEYTIYARCTNGVEVSTEVNKKVSTLDIATPTYEVINGEDPTKLKTVKITYPAGEGYRNSYSLDGGKTWKTVNGSTVSIDFTQNGTVIARVYDGKNYKVASTFTLTLDEKYTGVENKEYVVGEKVKYGGLNWLVISDNGLTTTMILAGNYKTGKYGTSTSFASGNTAYDLVNKTFVTDNDEITSEIKKGAIILDSISNSYVRLPQKDELTKKIPNSSGTNFWTLTANGDSQVYYGLPDGGKQYSSFNYDLSKRTGPVYRGYGSSQNSITIKHVIDNDVIATTISNPSTSYSSTEAVASKFASQEGIGYYSGSVSDFTATNSYTLQGGVFATNQGLKGSCDHGIFDNNNKTCYYSCGDKGSSFEQPVSMASGKASASYCGDTGVKSFSYTYPEVSFTATVYQSWSFSKTVAADKNCDDWVSDAYGSGSSCSSENWTCPSLSGTQSGTGSVRLNCKSNCTGTATGDTYYFASTNNCSYRYDYSINTNSKDMGIRPVITVKKARK